MNVTAIVVTRSALGESERRKEARINPLAQTESRHLRSLQSGIGYPRLKPRGANVARATFVAHTLRLIRTHSSNGFILIPAHVNDRRTVRFTFHTGRPRRPDRGRRHADRRPAGRQLHER